MLVTEQNRQTDAPAPAGDDRPWRRAFLRGLAMFLVSKAGLAAVSMTAWAGDETPNQSPGRLLHLWSSQWDSGWFAPIAAVGYPPSVDDRHAAFFPLYPALIRLTMPVFGGNYWWAALAVANLAALAAVVVLHRFAEHEFDTGVAGRTTFLLLAYPTGFFLTAAYNEGLFIALMAASLYAMRRGRWWAAGGLGGLAATCRSAGFLLVLAFLFEHLRQNRWRPRPSILAGTLILAGIGAVMTLDAVVYGDPLAFSHAQKAYWNREFAWPGATIVDAMATVNPFGQRVPLFGDVWIHNALELGTVLLALAMAALALAGPWRLPREQLLLPLVGLGLIVFITSFPQTSSPYPLLSASRLGLEVLPTFMMLGVVSRNPVVERLALFVFLPLQGILAAHFLHGQWVA